jgi:drug/metabolite transporter (DMT)-like permease
VDEPALDARRSEPIAPGREDAGDARPGAPGVGRRALGAWATHAALFVVQLAFASQAVEAKIAMAPRDLGGEGISPWAVAMARMSGAAIFFQVLTRAAGVLTKTTWRDQLQVAWLSILGIALNQTLFLLGLRMTSPMSAALISVTIPVLAAAMAVIVGQERASARLAIGIAIALSGVVWLTGVHAVDRGALIVLANCLSYAAYIVFSRATIRRLGALTVIAWLFTWAAFLFAPLGAAPLALGMATWTARGWGFVAYIVLVPTIVAYLANAWALGRSSATLVTVYIYLQPLMTAVLAWLQLRQRPTLDMMLSGVLIVLGVSLVATRRGAAPAPAEE